MDSPAFYIPIDVAILNVSEIWCEYVGFVWWHPNFEGI